MPKPDIRLTKTQQKYQFTDPEKLELGNLAATAQRQRDEYEAQLTSIKSDYKGKIELAESQRNIAFRKLTDGYEMREVQAVVEMDIPKKGRKTYWLFDEESTARKGLKLHDEPMNQYDHQMLLEEQKS